MQPRKRLQHRLCCGGCAVGRTGIRRRVMWADGNDEIAGRRGSDILPTVQLVRGAVHHAARPSHALHVLQRDFECSGEDVYELIVSVTVCCVRRQSRCKRRHVHLDLRQGRRQRVDDGERAVAVRIPAKPRAVGCEHGRTQRSRRRDGCLRIESCRYGECAGEQSAERNGLRATRGARRGSEHVSRRLNGTSTIAGVEVTECA